MSRKSSLFALLAFLPIGLTHLAVAQNVSIQLTPQGLPIQIPAAGGSFDYIIAATNNGSTAQQATVWCMVTLPDSSVYGPVLGPATITLNPGQTLDRLRTQAVPAGAPEGNYSFNAYVGIYPDSVWDGDSFAFEKTLEGSELWVARYNGPGNSDDGAHSLVVDGGGNIYVTGASDAGGLIYDYATIQYNTSGNQIWVARYNGMEDGNDMAYSLALDDSGNVYVTGWSYGSGTLKDYATVKYDTSGNQIWVARYNGPADSHDEATSLALDGSGNIYVTGYSAQMSAWPYGYDYATVKYDASGNQIWVARYNGPGNGSDQVSSLAIDGGGNVYVTGWSYGSGTYFDYATVKYDASGNQLWVARYNGPGNDDDYAYSLAVDGGGNVYVTGESDGLAGTEVNYDYATVKYDAAGNQIWVARYNGPGNSADWAYSLAVDGGGNVYVTGWSCGSGTYGDYGTVKYDANGNQIWVARYNGPGNSSDFATSLAVDGGGNVHVTGGSEGNGTNSDYATVKYDSSGNQIWVARYNGPGNYYDQALSLAVDGGGNVYVTGSSDGQAGTGTNYDYATIKYSGGEIANWLPVEATVLGQPLPQECRLGQNYPNPFNAITAISYQLSANSYVRLRVYNPAGRLVETLVDGWRSAGTQELTFDASHLAAGMYVYRIQAGDWTESGKMVLLK
jgi:hypothetical protein